uniref:MOFRL-associated domain-containing protein n=1 Tax=Oncorhynchus tshawytscha TaxID=74940 RepID=A0A8C8C241_ONCTS
MYKEGFLQMQECPKLQAAIAPFSPILMLRVIRDPLFSDMRAREVFATGVQPDIVVWRGLERTGDTFLVNGHSFTLRNNLHLVGFGKNVLGIAAEAESIVGDHLVRVSATRDKGDITAAWERTWLKDGSQITVMEGAKHNLPDADTDAQGAAKCIKRLATAPYCRRRRGLRRFGRCWTSSRSLVAQLPRGGGWRAVRQGGICSQCCDWLQHYCSGMRRATCRGTRIPSSCAVASGVWGHTVCLAFMVYWLTLPAPVTSPLLSCLLRF